MLNLRRISFFKQPINCLLFGVFQIPDAWNCNTVIVKLMAMTAQWFDVFDKLLSGKDVMDDENDKCVPGVSWCRGSHAGKLNSWIPSRQQSRGWAVQCWLVNQDICVIRPSYIIQPAWHSTTPHYRPIQTSKLAQIWISPTKLSRHILESAPQCWTYMVSWSLFKIGQFGLRWQLSFDRDVYWDTEICWVSLTQSFIWRTFLIW